MVIGGPFALPGIAEQVQTYICSGKVAPAQCCRLANRAVCNRFSMQSWGHEKCSLIISAIIMPELMLGRSGF